MKKYLILILLFFFTINVQAMGIKKIATLEENKHTFISDIVSTSDEGFVIVGEIISNNSGNQDDDEELAIISKYNSNYEQEWIIPYGEDRDYDFNTFNSVTIHDDKYIVVGSALTSNGNISFIVAYDQKGNMLWEKEKDNIFFGNIIEDDNYYYVIGQNLALNDNYGVIIKYDNKGNIVWEENYYNNDDVSLRDISISNDNQSIIIVGYSILLDVEDCYSKGHRIIVSYDKNGNMNWDNEKDTSSYGAFNSILPINDGYLVTGYKNNKNIQSAAITKLDNFGNILWEKDYSNNKDIITDYYINVFPYKNNYLVIGDSTRDTSYDNIFNLFRGAFVNQDKSSLIYSIYDIKGNKIKFNKMNIGDFRDGVLLNNNNFILIQNTSKADRTSNSYIYLMNESIINHNFTLYFIIFLISIVIFTVYILNKRKNNVKENMIVSRV